MGVSQFGFVGGFPIPCSIPNYNRSYAMGSRDCWYIVMPTYKVVVYSGDSQSGSVVYIFDNTIASSLPLYSSATLQGNSCSLYRNGVVIANGYSFPT
jgi:hypothetical protein